MRIDRGDAVLVGTAVGAGPPVVLLHAGGETREVWAPIQVALAQHGVQAVAVDLRGHGQSTGEPTTLATLAADVGAVVGQLPAPVALVGASVGGLAAIAALAAPEVEERVAVLVLVDVVPDPPPDRARAWLHQRGMLAPRRGLVEDILARGPALRAAVCALRVPVVLVRGGPGSPVSDDDEARLRDGVPDVTVVRIDAAGHLVARDAPDELAAVLVAVAASRLTPDPARARAVALLEELGARDIAHPGGDLLSHLLRVHEVTVGWGASRPVRLAALCHAAYGTDGFPPALLPVDRRARLRAVIGREAEHLVHLYGMCDRAHMHGRLGSVPLPVRDRLTGAVVDLDRPAAADLAVLTIANELDVVRHADLDEDARRAIRTLMTGLATYAPAEAAAALADPAVG